MERTSGYTDRIFLAHRYTIDTLLCYICRVRNTKEFIPAVAIIGPSCCGKSSAVNGLVIELDNYQINTTVLGQDEYDLYPSGSPQVEKTVRRGRKNWEDPRLFDLSQMARDLEK